MAEENKQEERKLRDPRDVNKRPRSSGKAAPDHVRVQEHGIRTTAGGESEDPGNTLITELQRENFKEVQAEDYKRTEARPSAAGPNPYSIPTSREALGGKKVMDKLLKEREDNELDNSLLQERALGAHAAATGDSDGVDAEVQVIGATISDTGQKIVPKPDRVAADDKAVLRRVKDDSSASQAIDEDIEPHSEAYYRALANHESSATSDDPLRADANPGPGAQPIHEES